MPVKSVRAKGWTVGGQSFTLAPVGQRNVDGAKLLTQLRGQHDWSQEELSRRSGVSVKAISRFENGKTKELRRPSREALARALNVDQGIFAGKKPAHRQSYSVEDALVRLEGKIERIISLLEGSAPAAGGGAPKLPGETGHHLRGGDSTPQDHEPPQSEPGKDARSDSGGS